MAALRGQATELYFTIINLCSSFLIFYEGIEILMTMAHPFQLNELESGVPPQPPFLTPALWFVFCDSALLVRLEVRSTCDSQCSAKLPQAEASQELVDLTGIGSLDPQTKPQFLGFLRGQACYAVDGSTPNPAQAEHQPEQRAKQPTKQHLDAGLDAGYSFHPLKRLYGVLSEPEFALAGRAVQLLRWSRDHRFCSRCATSLELNSYPHSRRCPQCGLRHGPRLSPAIIVRVTRGDEILLARSPRFRPGLYSVLAGFVEPGESLEDTVRREVQEEVGIHLSNIRYFGSQPWPFPDSLMLAFTADYAGGIVTPEPGEIEDVAWFTRDRIPSIPGPLSIARRMIEQWIVQDS